jgi:predicted house-cleaning noncanonical NTP pyrophosphatase (MazG superfamily)
MTTKKHKAPKVATITDIAKLRNLMREYKNDQINWELRRERIFNMIRNSGISPEKSNLPLTPKDLAGRLYSDLKMEMRWPLTGEELEELAITWVNNGLGKPIAKRDKTGDKGRGDKREGASNAGRKLEFVTRRLCVHYLISKPDMTPKLICKLFEDYENDLRSRDEPDSKLLPKIKREVYAWNPTEEKIKNDNKVIADHDKLRTLQDKLGVNEVTIKDFQKWCKSEGI